ncbi:MAG: hypothetical protein R2844_09535 [Caldilineales bacterium]
MVWLVEAKLDNYVTSCQEGDVDCTCYSSGELAGSCVLSQRSVVTTFYENKFRITGLQVSQSMDAQVGLFGTSAPTISTDPNIADEDNIMMTLMSAGLNGSFLNYVNPDLNQIAANFGDPTAQPPYTPTWSIDPAVMHVVTGTYAHRDEALATTTQTTTVQFLDQNYVDCTLNTTAQVTPTLALAYQETAGFIGMADKHMTIINGSGNIATSAPVQFSVPLADTVLAKTRQVQLNSYACGLDDSGAAAWRGLSVGEALGELNRRYADYMDEPWFGPIQQLFITYDSGRSNILSANGTLINGVGQLAPDDAYAQFTNCQDSAMPDCVRQSYAIDGLLLKVDELGSVNGYWEWGRDLADIFSSLSFVDRLLYGITKIMAYRAHAYAFSQVEAPWVYDKIPQGQMQQANYEDFANHWYEGGFEEFKADMALDESSAFLEAQIEQGYFEVPAYQDVNVRSVAYQEIGNNLNKVTSAANALLFLIFVVSIWVGYAVAIDGATSIQQDIALAQAIAGTIILTVQLLTDLIFTYFQLAIEAATFTGFGLFLSLLVLVLLYVIVAAISGDWNPLNTTQELAKLILNVNVLAQVPDSGIATGPLNMRVEASGAPANGAVPASGTTFKPRSRRRSSSTRQRRRRPGTRTRTSAALTTSRRAGPTCVGRAVAELIAIPHISGPIPHHQHPANLRRGWRGRQHPLLRRRRRGGRQQRLHRHRKGVRQRRQPGV